jgi:hypothetical protein
MTSFVHDDFLRIMHKAARKYSCEEYRNVDEDVVVNKVLVSFRSHLEDLKEETQWKEKENITDKFVLSETVEIPDSDEITAYLNFLRTYLKNFRT